MTQIRENLYRSFALVKRDLLQMQEDFKQLDNKNEQLKRLLADARNRDKQLSDRIARLKERISKVQAAKKARAVVKTVAQRAKKVYVAAKTGKTVHLNNCPFAKNIKPKSRLVFKSKTKALNAGFKACECLKRI